MIGNIFNEPAQVALEFALDATAANGQLIAHNIANADTPNYKAVRLHFHEHLERELNRAEHGTGIGMTRTNQQHLGRLAPGGLEGISTPYGLIYTEDATTYRLDGNNVDIDHEMAEQAKNSLQFAILTELANRRFQELRTAIAGGR